MQAMLWITSSPVARLINVSTWRSLAAGQQPALTDPLLNQLLPLTISAIAVRSNWCGYTCRLRLLQTIHAAFRADELPLFDERLVDNRPEVRTRGRVAARQYLFGDLAHAHRF